MKLALFLNLTLFLYVNGATFFAVFPWGDIGKNILYQKLVKALADRGHFIVIISPYEFVETIQNGSVVDFYLDGFQQYYHEMAQELYYENVTSDTKRFYLERGLDISMKVLSDKSLSEKALSTLRENRNTFDLFLTDLHYSDSILIYGSILNCPTVVFSTLAGYSLDDELPAEYITAHEKLVEQYWPKQKVGITQLRKSISLVLSNSHEIFLPRQPQLPSINIGGFHIETPERLPDDLKEFVDTAFDGVVYCNLGSGTNTSSIPEAKLKNFIGAFEKLKLKVIMRVDDGTQVKLTKNVFAKRWLPQNDILGHKRTKLFITNGGQASFLEAAYYGVPVLVVPLANDQFYNADLAQKLGIGLKLAYSDLRFSEDTILELIRKIVDDASFTNKAKDVSGAFRNSDKRPLEVMLSSIEKVLKGVKLEKVTPRSKIEL